MTSSKPGSVANGKVETEMVRLDSATHPDGESSDAALLRNVDGDAAAEVGTSAPQDADAEKVAGAGQSSSTSKDVMDSAAKKLQLMRSLCYVFSFIAAGLMVGTCGPALPTLLKRLEQKDGGHGDMVHAGESDGEDVADTSALAGAFAYRALGGLVGSIGGGAALMRLSSAGHWILAGGLVIGAGAPAIVRFASEVNHVSFAFILLDFGCGCVQVANTMMVWVHSVSPLYISSTQWLNVLNGSFGIGTLVSPALVAFLDFCLGSTAAAVEASLLIVPLLVLLIAAAIMCVPSPSAPPEDKEPNSGDPGNALEASETENQPAGAGEDEAKPVKPIAPDSWEWVAAVGLTTLGLNAAVGAETTFGTFLVAYVEAQREAGMLNVAEARADLITSFFWTSFTVGRFGSVGLERAFPTHPFAVMAVQIWVLQCGWMLVLGMPSSEGALWLSSLLVGGGVGGLFAGFIGQLSCRVHFSSFVGGCMGLGAMSGVALWNTTAAALGAHTATLVVAAASLVTVACQALLVPLFRRADRKKTDCKRRTEDPDVC